MRKITIQTSKPYDVLIGSSLLASIGKEISKVTKSKNTVIVSDSNVWPYYGDAVTSALQQAGFTVTSFVFPAGEESKNGTTYLSLLNFLAEHKITRSDTIIALGGGVVGDLTGFAAATYLRGIRCIQVPTTLLAMVDSSVGGKTAIDLPAGKNLVGAFYQPSRVICDINTLSTLPADVFRAGCAEVIKYAVLYSTDLFEHLEAFGPAFDLETVIAQCVQFKRDVVMQDEFDNGMRQMLNLGHTFGHGVEAASRFQISHGDAVAIGMAMIVRAAVKRNICTAEVQDRLLSLLTQFQLPASSGYHADTIYEAALSDKKRSGDTINLIIPEQLGRCGIFPTPVQQMKSFIEAGM